ncbi:retrovirus-related pol polyprotein from transposon TNT 1-94 [Tanacetum coccineum]|uniref:Retrovirus-related pol polyprotein from transposon TNT 1-94 n=1 Tax=Tanacetum coccineum TaxID=301880 RepID=A0ABQ5GF71_9ASTR
MSGTVPPISPPLGTSTGNPVSPIVNRVDTMPINDAINITTITNFDIDDFTSWKVRFLVFLDGLEPYLVKTLEDGPFVPMSNLSTLDNPLLKRQNQLSNVESRLANQDKRFKSIIISCLQNDGMKFVIKCKSEKATWNDLLLAYEGPSDTKDTKIAALRLKFNAFKSLKGEKVNGTFTRIKFLLNYLENNGVIIPQAEVNAMFVNSLPRKWLSMNQTQRANNSIKNDCLATLYGKYNCEEGLIDHIYESKTQRFTIQALSSKALIFNNQFQDSDSNVKDDQRTNNEFMADLNAEYHERDLLDNQKRFYKRCGWVEPARKPMDKLKETFFTCGKLGHFQKDCPFNKTSTPSYPSPNNSFNKPKPYTLSFTQIPSQNIRNHQKDKVEIAALTQRTDDLSRGKNEKGKNDKGKSEKGLIPESFDWDDESVSSEDKRTTTIKAFIEIVKDEPSVRKADIRSVSGNIVKALKGRGRRKENNSSKEVIFTKADESSSEPAPETASNSESKSDLQDPLPPLPKLTRKKTKTKSLVVLKSGPDKKADHSIEKLLLILMEEVKGLKEQIQTPSASSPYDSQASCFKSKDHMTKEHIEQADIKKTFVKLKGQSPLTSTPKKMPKIPKPFRLPKEIENLNEVKVKQLRSDNETKFRNHTLEEFCDLKGISQNFSSPCTLKQNGLAERRNRTLIKEARTMLNSARLPKQFWGEAVNAAC